MMMGEATASFRPVDAEGQLQWGLIAVRWIGAALMVPVMEELFWRSFLMRWVDNPDFEKVDARRATLKAVVLSTVVFTLAHTQWLAAIVAGLAYAWLYRRTGKLWAPIVAHAVTNGVLGAWVVFHGNWAFW
jgi:CAAX prenyl protease-like protein